MKKTLVIIGIALVSSIIIGCGNSDKGSSIVADSIGKYKDSFISGIAYKCGNISGITNNDGQFKFSSSEKAKGCSFMLKGIVLRKDNDLYNGKEIIEDNLSVSILLQALDYDGNLSNGININSEIKNTLSEINITYVLNDNNFTNVVNRVNKLTEEIKQKISNFNRKEINMNRVISHLSDTVSSEFNIDINISKALIFLKNGINKKWAINNLKSYFNSSGLKICVGSFDKSSLSIECGVYIPNAPIFSEINTTIENPTKVDISEGYIENNRSMEWWNILFITPDAADNFEKHHL